MDHLGHGWLPFKGVLKRVLLTHLSRSFKGVLKVVLLTHLTRSIGEHNHILAQLFSLTFCLLSPFMFIEELIS